MTYNTVITMTTKEYSKEGHLWSLDNIEAAEISESMYKKITKDDTLKFFRRLGGFERATRAYTCCGYNVVHLTSINQDKTVKIVRSFSFELVNEVK